MRSRFLLGAAVAPGSPAAADHFFQYGLQLSEPGPPGYATTVAIPSNEPLVLHHISVWCNLNRHADGVVILVGEKRRRFEIAVPTTLSHCMPPDAGSASALFIGNLEIEFETYPGQVRSFVADVSNNGEGQCRIALFGRAKHPAP